MNTQQLLQEENVSLAFSKQSAIFDQIDEENKIILWIRNRVQQEVLGHIQKDAHLLELNCGTGIDALFFVHNGIRVTATDNAPGMLQQLNQKIEQQQLQDRIKALRCSFNELQELGTATQYDYVFSNFGGLNCTPELGKVLQDIDRLLKPGGRFTLVIMPRFCPWEVLLAAKGKFRFAFRRLKKGPVSAKVEGQHFDCYYYSPDFIIRHLGATFDLLSLKSLSLTTPPPFVENFIERFPKTFSRLERWENKWCSKAPFNRWGDHFMITMEKKK
ncbi:MAG TPA: class I SAM-dependent methyltransferase [Chitinophagaceae bacterium]|nr:class I SAM-dependent methyltransferase [Chitinophagaceae bacterium]